MMNSAAPPRGNAGRAPARSAPRSCPASGTHPPGIRRSRVKDRAFARWCAPGAPSYARDRKGGISMKRYTGSEMVEPGLYFNPRQLSFKSVDEEDRKSVV